MVSDLSAGLATRLDDEVDDSSPTRSAAPTDPPRVPRSTLRGWLPVASAVVIMCALALLIAFPVGFSAGRADPQGGGYYQRLADGYLHGELGIRERPPQSLLELDDPFDPATNHDFLDRYGRWDATLAGDRLYYYWGPAPVAVVVVPLRLVGIHVTETDMGILAALVIIVVIGLLVRRISQRWPMPPWLEFFTTLGLAAFFSGFHLLRNVAIWQATVLVAGALGMIALYQFVCAALAPRERAARHWLIGGVALALAIGTRPTYAVFCLVPLGFLGVRYLWQRRDGVAARTMARPLTFALAPTAIVLVMFFAYNQARFGSPTDFGLSRVLSPSSNTSTLTFSSLSYALPNAYYYLVRPLSLAPVFPFLSFDGFRWPFQTPHEYAEYEPVLGILTTSPLLLLGMVVVVRGAFVRRARRDDRFTVTAVLVAVALIMVAIVSTGFFSATQRYRVEPDVLLTAAAVVAVSLVWSFLRRAGTRRLFVAVVGVLAAFSALVSVLGAYHGHMPFSPARNAFGNELAAIGEPVEDVTLADAPYVTVEPQTDLTGPVALDDGFLLQADGRLDVYARGDCAVRIELDRDTRDREPMTLTGNRATRIEIHPMRVVIEVPPGADHRVIKLTMTRYDGWPFTAFTGGRSTYDCS